MLVSNIQIRTARANLKLDLKEVADATGITLSHLSSYENGGKGLGETKLRTLINFFEARGIVFTENEGVQRKPQGMVRILQGADGFSLFLDDIYATAKEQGGEFCISNVNERNWTKWAGEKQWDEHNARMQEIAHAFTDKIIIKENDYFFLASAFAEYRWMPEELFNEQTLYAYGDKLAFLNFTENDVQILILKQKEFADGFRVLFNAAWEGTTIIPPKKTG
jgi:transcriptional regulator with XRE-family HTH domain